MDDMWQLDLHAGDSRAGRSAHLEEDDERQQALEAIKSSRNAEKKFVTSRVSWSTMFSYVSGNVNLESERNPRDAVQCYYASKTDMGYNEMKGVIEEQIKGMKQLYLSNAYEGHENRN
ncbi:hypothetical protein ACH5RR_009440 [Cinchona calisaya]|uniref:Uncharacterized protein n=1 Tax=Cinchona calisaya TaxID=153742 RepID=A0ABD3AIE7_9GENT